MTAVEGAPEAGGVAAPAQPAATKPPERRRTGWRRWRWAIAGIFALLLLVAGVPWAITAWNTVSTDDAFVNGHVTFVAPRVAGQVARVLVDDNNRVHKGDLLVQLDQEPYQVQVNIAQAAVAAAQADLVAAQAQVRGLAGLARSQRFNLAHAIEDLDNQVAELRARVATLQSKKATLDQSPGRLRSGTAAGQTGGRVEAGVRRLRGGPLGGPGRAGEGTSKTSTRFAPDSGCRANPRTATTSPRFRPTWTRPSPRSRRRRARLMQTAAQLGVVYSFDASPEQMLADFYKRDPEGNIDRIFAQLLKDAPAVKQAEAKVAEAQANLDQAELNLRYCDVVAEIDGVVTRRSVNPGDHVIAGQSMMALRSLTDIWVDANFKETQLAELRIGQAGGSGRGHVRQSPALPGPHLRLHDGNGLDAGAAAGGERDRELRQGRAAPAGAHRAAGLRSGHRAAVRRSVGHAVRPREREAHRTGRRKDAATVPGRAGRRAAT